MNDDAKTLRKLALWLGIPFLVLIALAAVLLIQNRLPSVHVPARKMPNPNGWDDFMKAAAVARAVRPIGPYWNNSKPGDWTDAELRTWLLSATPALDRARKGLTKQCARPPGLSDWGIHQLAQMFAGEALYYSRTGKPGKAVDSLLDGIEMCVVMQRGAGLTGGLSALSSERASIQHLGPLLPKSAPDGLARVAKRMERIGAKRVPYSEVLMDESRYLTRVLTNSFRASSRVDMSFDPHGYLMNHKGGNTPSLTDRVKHSVSFAFTSKTGMINGNREYLEALAKEQTRPYTGKSSVPVRHDPIADVLGGMYVEGRWMFVRNESVFGVLQTEVAIRRYSADQGHYPRTLKELAPKYLKSVPVDPFGVGRKLRYRRIKGGKSFLLYSVGPDMHDDGGQAIVGRIRNTTTGDIVAGTVAY